VTPYNLKLTTINFSIKGVANHCSLENNLTVGAQYFYGVN